MRVEQLTKKPCAFCALISKLGELSEFDKFVYQEHLRFDHNMKEYWIER